MKIVSQYKKFNLIITLLSAGAVACVYGYFHFGYCVDNCSTELIRGYLNPFYNFFLGLTIITAIFMILPAHYFKIWLKFILPVATILIFVHAADVSVYTSGILNMSRAEVVRFDMFIFGLVSAIFVAITFAIKHRKNKISKQNISK